MSAVTDLLSAFQSYLADRRDREVNRFVGGFEWRMAERSIAPGDLPVVAYLKQAALPGSPLLERLVEAADSLRWAQTYTAGDFGDAFLARYGWVELFGTRGHFESDVMAGGFLLLGPEIHYPDHHHVAEEIYIPLTPGSFWSKDGGAFVARDVGEIIHHPSNVRHAMRTEKQALVALYLWRGGPLAQKSIISGKDT